MFQIVESRKISATQPKLDCGGARRVDRRNVGGKRLLKSYALVAGLVLLAAPALADPCEAIPEKGPLPSYLSPGARFSGFVVHVIDGDSLCVEISSGEKGWVEVRLSDFYAPESGEAGGATARDALNRIAMGKRADCVASMRTYDRIAARCAIGGRAIGDLMRADGVNEGGRGTGELRNLGRSSPSGGFQSCAEARAAGAAPVRRGQPGYNPKLDGDADGIACEPYRRR